MAVVSHPAVRHQAAPASFIMTEMALQRVLQRTEGRGERPCISAPAPLKISCLTFEEITIQLPMVYNEVKQI